MFLRDRKRNTWIRQLTGVNDIITTIRKKTSTVCAGHVAILGDNRLTLRVTECTQDNGHEQEEDQKRAGETNSFDTSETQGKGPRATGTGEKQPGRAIKGLDLLLQIRRQRRALTSVGQYWQVTCKV